MIQSSHNPTILKVTASRLQRSFFHWVQLANAAPFWITCGMVLKKIQKSTKGTNDQSECFGFERYSKLS